MEAAPDLIERQLTDVVGDLQKSKNDHEQLTDYDARRISTRAQAAIKRWAPPGSPYEAQAVQVGRLASEETKAKHFAAIAHALRDDYALGGLSAVEELVHADLFDDFLAMAEELHAKGFVGPAAILAGSVLEEHLRKLATKFGIESAPDGRPRTVETLGVALKKAGAISEVQRKSVSAWYAQRNEGAHGHFEELSDGDVERMIDGVRDFVARHIA
jgi:hypothetical protein